MSVKTTDIKTKMPMTDIVIIAAHLGLSAEEVQAVVWFTEKREAEMARR